ncbi:MAG: hypothetical protein U0228_29590 [Myxococcaceae bacterium]
MRGNMMRAAVALAFVVVGGCQCPENTVTCSDTTINFETPTDGMTVDSPFTVAVNVKAPDGSAFNIDAATLNVGGTSFTGTVSGNRATFTGVTASAGAQQLSVAIAQGSCSKTATSNVTVRSACTGSAVTAVSFPQDTLPAGPPRGDNKLNSTELPIGSNLQIKVDATCVDGVQVRIKNRGNGSTVAGPADFVNGTVTLTAATLPDSDNATYDLFAELVQNGTAINTPTSNPLAQASITVNRAKPTVMLTTQPSYGPGDDADLVTPGIQIRVTGTAPPTGVTCTMTMDNGTPVPANPSSTGDVSNDFTLTSGSHTVTLSCTDMAGNVGTATATFVVDIDPPTIVITSPANVDGGATMLVTQSPLPIIITVTGAEGQTVSATLPPGSGCSGDTETVTNGTATLFISCGTDGSKTVTIKVSDTAGNEATATLNFTVQLTGCGAAFTRPMACPTLLTTAQLSNGMYSFQTTSNAVCSGQPARLFRTDNFPDGGMSAEVAAGSTTLSGSGVAAFPPLALTNGDYTYRAEVTNPNDGGISETHCDVTVDLDGPSITNPAAGSGPTIINASQDSQPGTPGVQRTLGFSARVPVGGHVDVCTTQAVDPVTMQQRMTSPECGSGWYVLAQNVSSPVSGFTFPDGAYSIKIVVVGSGLPVAPESPAVQVLVVSQRPCATAKRLPQDVNNDRKLNIAELNGNPATLEFTLGCGATAATLAATNPITVRDVVAGAPAGTRASTYSIAANVVTVTLTGSGVAEADLDLFIDIADVAGNRSLFSASDFTFRIDPVAPTCDIQTPSASQTLVGQAGAPGGMFSVVVGTAADVGTNGVHLTFGGQPARDVTPTANVATSIFAVSGTAAYAVAAVCTDGSGNATTATTRNLTIDLDAPTCNITAPTASTYTANQIATSVTVGGADGQPVTMRSSLSGTPLTPTLTVVTGVASGNVTYPNGTQTISASVADPAGNTCTAMVANVVINSTSCTFNLTNVVVNAAGSWFNRSNTGSLTATTGTISSVNANSPDCKGNAVTLVRTLPTAGSPAMSTTNGSTGDVSFANVAVADGETWTVTINNGAGILTTQTFRVGLKVPVATAATIGGNALTSGQALFFVAPTGNINLDTTATGNMPKVTTYFPDTQPGTAGSQTQFAATGIGNTRYGSDLGKIEVLYGAATPISSTLATDPMDLAATGLSLTHATTGAFIVRITSAAGNATDFISSTATVDVIAPGGPTVAQSLTSARAATVSLQWSPVYDDGTDNTSGGLTGGPVAQPAGYDVRWTTTSVSANNAMVAVSDFFGTAAKQEGITAWSANPITKPVTVPPINTYYLAVRARDDVGNYSTFVQPTALPNPWTTTVMTAPVASTSFGTSVVLGTLVGNDGAPDMVVSAPGVTGGGAVYVYDSTLLPNATTTGCPAGCQTLSPSDTVGGAFGSDLAVGNIGAVASEVKPDLVIAQTWSAAPNSGRVVLFFGTTAATLNPADSIEFRGDTNNRIGQTVSVIKDITGDGRDEIAIAAPLFSSNRGRVFIYKGRDRADWLTIRTATDGTTSVQYVPVGTANADYVIDGPSPLLVSPAGNAFGQNRRGFISVNDLDGDTFPDVAIPMSRGTINKYRVFGSATIKTSTGASPLDSTASFRLEVNDTAIADNANTSGMGVAAIGNADLFGSSGADLVVSYPGAGGGGQIIFMSAVTAPTTPTLNPSVSTRIVGPLTFGQCFSMGTLDGDVNQDVVSGTNAASGNVAYVLYQNLATFETNPQAAFFVSKFDATAITSNASSRLGSVNLLRDINNDATIDLVLVDPIGGEVRTWR